MMPASWVQFIRKHWAELVGGAKVDLPAGLAHPRSAGFIQFAVADQHGQVSNWGLALADGSRLHARQYPDGRWDLHRDKYDPGRGPAWGIVHVLTESWWGRGLALVGLGALVGGVLWKGAK